MNIVVLDEREQTTANVVFAGKTVKELLEQLQINPETVLVIRNDEVLTGDTVLVDNDRIDLLSVVSGG